MISIKKIFILLILVFLFTGCDIRRVDDDKIEKTIDNIVNKNNDLYNTYSYGYKYYLPKNMIRTVVKGSNEILYSNNTDYYLYVDITAYLNNTVNEYEVNENAYFSKIISYKEIKYLITINKINNKYHIRVENRFSKIETVVDENNINDSIINIISIITSISFNDNILKNESNLDNVFYKEEKFELFQKSYVHDNYLNITDGNTTVTEDKPIYSEDFINTNKFDLE